MIEAHADNIGASEYNKELTLRRAKKVKDHLVGTFGVSEKMLAVSGEGESRPWTTNNTIEGRRANRRIEIIRIRSRPASMHFIDSEKLM